MLNDYYKQCCLLIFPQFAGIPAGAETGFTAFHSLTAAFAIEKRVFTSNEISASEWTKNGYTAKVNTSGDAQKQCIEAFETAFEDQFRKVVMINCAPANLEHKHLEEAFLSIRILEFCMGPRKDGLLYLLGMNQFRPEIFPADGTTSPFLYKAFQRKAGDMKAALYRTPIL